jgi:transposase
MTNLNLSDVRIFVCLTPIKMQFSFDTLMGLAQEIFDQDPLSGHLFLFFNRKRDRIKILYWDVDGFCIWYKRLEVGVFQLPVATEGDQGIELDSRQLSQLLEGLDLRNGRRRRRYRRVS